MLLLLTWSSPYNHCCIAQECVHSVTGQVESLHPAVEHSKSRIIKVDICVTQISFRIQFAYSMPAHYSHIQLVSYFHRPFFPAAARHYLPLRTPAIAALSLSLSVSILYPGKNLSLVQFILLPYLPFFFCPYANFLHISYCPIFGHFLRRTFSLLVL